MANSETANDSVRPPRNVVVVIAILTGISASVAALSLIGWAARSPVLTGWLTGGVLMNPATALVIILAAGAVCLQGTTDGSTSRRLALAGGAVVTLVAVTKSIALLGIADAGVDQFLFASQLGSNRMAPNTALALTFLGIAILLRSDGLIVRRCGQVLALAASALAMISVLGYMYSTSSLYSVGSYTPMAFNTAVALSLLSFATALTRDNGRWLQFLVHGGTAGLLLRRLLPTAIALPTLLGWVRLVGQRRGMYSTEMGTALLVVAIISISAALSIWLVNSVAGLELARSEAERLVKQKLQFETEAAERQKVTEELVALNHQLADARDAALEAKRLQSAILANVSHELRTPLTAISGYLQLLQLPDGDCDENREMVVLLRDSTRRLQHLIDDFIELAGLEAGAIVPKNSPFDLGLMIQRAVEEVRGTLEKNNNRVSVDIANQELRITGDPTLLGRALRPLLLNAGKFTQDGTIRITAEQREDEPGVVQIRVEDTGIGISQTQLSKLFRPFSQVDDSLTRSFGGVGLGLVVARRISELMGGEITLETVESRGSTFILKIPTQAPRSFGVRRTRTGSHSE